MTNFEAFVIGLFLGYVMRPVFDITAGTMILMFRKARRSRSTT